MMTPSGGEDFVASMTDNEGPPLLSYLQIWQKEPKSPHRGSPGGDMSLAHLTLATRDVRKAQAFFKETLGWQPIARPNNIGRPAAWLEIVPGQELHLIEVVEFATSPFEAEFGRHVAVSVPLEAFDGLKQRLQAHGATLIDPERPTPFARFFFRNPDGYVFEVVAAERTPEATGSAD
jgi:catechol 2,3-dioxygenase-like lactoylglutathione lyase family enzyme